MIQTSEEEMKKIESEFYSQGYSLIAGVDEAGCGPLAGPVVACAVILPKDYFNPLIYDSKKLTPKLREELCDVILKIAIDVGIGEASNEEIDKYNIRNATKLAMIRALQNLETIPDVVLIDGNLFDVNFTGLNFDGKKVLYKNIIKGDRKSISIASASIIAKVTRDKIMEQYAKEFPQYNFLKHKGYPTREHLQEIEKFGITKIHRKSYRPIQKILNPAIQEKLFQDER
ncbi:ribonuclease HII [Candidatus Chrysopegis kryptomonas]|jgi:ribonuclease HII|uniref:Ribonuclease HII n=1 Tax=Candidatus Chryseopegocella kryptomonas TaxID=1633643 RepID=A0A0P1NYS2_9BACT|nr:ribonuclease HII [Candidatus Chrysopegis kryptomonas]CUT04393.1 RNase HII [Candidatus Chrysopegis kryptomonas]